MYTTAELADIFEVYLEQTCNLAQLWNYLMNN